MPLVKVKYPIPSNWALDMLGRDENSNFHAILYRLIWKADSINLERIRKAFPLEVAAYEAWKASPEQKFPEFVEIVENRTSDRLGEISK